MAGGTMDVVVRFVGDASSLATEANKVEGIGGKLASFGKTAGLAIGGAFAVSAITDWVGEAENAQKATATLTQTLANAGDASGQWAAHADDLASSLQSQTGIDDEIIKGGQAILATFHEVSGATGQAAGTFDRATKAAVDMSAAGFGSVESASTMLGKALQDPIKGITALGRAGVTFTEVQKDQIKAMVAAGDAAGAQALILKEVENQVGGTAAASATAGDKMAASFGEAKESIGAALLPVLQQLAPILQTVAGFVQANATWLVPLAAAVLAVVAAVKAWTIVQTIINVLMTANPIGLIIVGIAALIAIIVVLIKNWDTVAAVAVAAWDWILSAITGVWDWIVAHWPLLLTILLGPIGAAVAAIIQNWDAIQAGIAAVIDWIVGHWPLILAVLTGPIGAAVAVIIAGWDTITGALGSAIDAMKGLWDGLVSFVSNIPGQIASALSGFAGQLYSIGVDWMQSLLRGITSMAGSIIDKAKSIASSAISFLNPFDSPDTKAFYTGQAVMADFARGMQSRQTAAARAAGLIGGAVAPALGATPAGAGAGGTTVNVTVNVPPTANLANVGREIAGALDAFYTRSGTRRVAA